MHTVSKTFLYLDLRLVNLSVIMNARLILCFHFTHNLLMRTISFLALISNCRLSVTADKNPISTS